MVRKHGIFVLCDVSVEHYYVGMDVHLDISRCAHGPPCVKHMHPCLYTYRHSNMHACVDTHARHACLTYNSESNPGQTNTLTYCTNPSIQTCIHTHIRRYVRETATDAYTSKYTYWTFKLRRDGGLHSHINQDDGDCR